MKTIYLFLDVDGVLNNQKIIQETKKMQVIDEQNLINLNKLIKTIKKEDNCSIILNSSWQLVNENIDILVIDDGMIREIKDRLIKCDFNHGFTEVELQKAIKLLRM